MDKEKESKEKKCGYTMYINVPQTQHIHAQGWDNECKARFKDDRFQKLIHDHNFVFQFASRLRVIEESLKRIESIITSKEEKKEELKNQDLFKK